MPSRYRSWATDRLNDQYRFLCTRCIPNFKHSGCGVFLTDSFSRVVGNTSHVEPNYVVHFVENLYDSCAGYNLRYCPLRGFVTHSKDNYFSRTVKDIATLLCFLFANFVVFLAIVAKTMVHMYFAVCMTVDWITKFKCFIPGQSYQDCPRKSYSQYQCPNLKDYAAIAIQHGEPRYQYLGSPSSQSQ
ncbi:uncharacterized protein LOC118265456 isoform X2 [Spodoptera frugiperda]|uniref:Uncharacterized protein LOC118265456 isoform X2 n=1 Tax=Spodoptera frugiperda TaxID=7108 RepID=A0A9R0CYX8_SPOFR|nr:uncharacterized protein LOC118265456 isoform X2 [Spodoptera frugiperda]